MIHLNFASNELFLILKNLIFNTCNQFLENVFNIQ